MEDRLTDEELLDFDHKRLGGIRTAPRTLLDEHGDVYRAQLAAALWLDGYGERRSSSPRRGMTGVAETDGYAPLVKDDLDGPRRSSHREVRRERADGRRLL